MERLAGKGQRCDVDRRIASGERLDFAGTNVATAADVTVKTEPVDATGPTKMAMAMRVTSYGTGECRAGDVIPPTPGATS